MAEVVWSAPALADLDAIADYIALDNPEAAAQLVHRIFDHIDHLAAHPEPGSKPSELRGWQYRQIIEPPCRIFYRIEPNAIYIVHVMRSEQKLHRTKLLRRSKPRS